MGCPLLIYSHKSCIVNEFNYIFLSRRSAEEEEAMEPLFETKKELAKAKFFHRVYAATVFVGICLILNYRLVNFPGGGGRRRRAWIGIFMAEFFLSLFWIISQSVRWNVKHNLPFKDRLSLRLI